IYKKTIDRAILFPIFYRLHHLPMRPCEGTSGRAAVQQLAPRRRFNLSVNPCILAFTMSTKPLFRILLLLNLLCAAGFAPAQNATPSFADWLSELRAEAAQRGISESTLDSALAQVREPEPRV